MNLIQILVVRVLFEIVVSLMERLNRVCLSAISLLLRLFEHFVDFLLGLPIFSFFGIHRRRGLFLFDVNK